MSLHRRSFLGDLDKPDVLQSNPLTSFLFNFASICVQFIFTLCNSFNRSSHFDYHVFINVLSLTPVKKVIFSSIADALLVARPMFSSLLDSIASFL